MRRIDVRQFLSWLFVVGIVAAPSVAAALSDRRGYPNLLALVLVPGLFAYALYRWPGGFAFGSLKAKGALPTAARISLGLKMIASLLFLSYPLVMPTTTGKVGERLWWLPFDDSRDVVAGLYQWVGMPEAVSGISALQIMRWIFGRHFEGNFLETLTLGLLHGTGLCLCVLALALVLFPFVGLSALTRSGRDGSAEGLFDG